MFIGRLWMDELIKLLAESNEYLDVIADSMRYFGMMVVGCLVWITVGVWWRS